MAIHNGLASVLALVKAKAPELIGINVSTQKLIQDAAADVLESVGSSTYPLVGYGPSTYRL